MVYTDKDNKDKDKDKDHKVYTDGYAGAVFFIPYFKTEKSLSYWKTVFDFHSGTVCYFDGIIVFK